MRLHEAIETALVIPSRFAITNQSLVIDRSGAFLTFAPKSNTQANVMLLNFPAHYELIGVGVKRRDFITYGMPNCTTFCPTVNDFMRDDWEVYHLELK